MTVACRSCSGVLPPRGRNGSQTTISSSGMPFLTPVLRPRCSSGKKKSFSPRANAQSKTRPALEEGQDHLLGGGGEDVGALGHEVDAAEQDELGPAAAGGLLRELEGVAAEVG